MTLIEVVVALPIVIIALGMFIQMLTAGAGLRDGSRDDWTASTAAQDVLEQIRNEDFRQVFLLYNADPFDDPGGPGTAPGSTFAVEGLTPLDTDPDGLVGEILLPVVNVGTEVVPDWQVREDVANNALGTPRDLNGDSFIDAISHADDYTLIPVGVRLRWQGRFGPREFRMFTVFSELR